MVPPTSKGKNTRLRVLCGAGALFRREGFGNCTVADICRESDLAVGGFYRHFSGKEEVLSAIVELAGERLRQRMGGLEKISDTALRLEKVFSHFFEFAAENRDHYQVLRESEFVMGEAARSFYEAYVGILLDLFNFPGAGKDEKEIFAYSVIGVQSFFAMKTIVWENARVPDEISGQLALVCLEGISGGGNPDLASMLAQAGEIKISPSAWRNADDTRKRLLSSAEHVFGRMGFRKASVAEIAGRAGFAVGTFYKCFKSKEEAFRELTKALRAELVARASFYSEGARTRLETELLAFSAFLGFVRDHGSGYRIIREAEFVDFSLAESYYMTILESYSQSMEESAGRKEFSLSDYTVLALCMMGMGHMLGLKYVLWNKRGASPALVEKMARQIFLGIKGEKQWNGNVLS